MTSPYDLLGDDVMWCGQLVTVIGYCAEPTFVIQHHDGRKHSVAARTVSELPPLPLKPGFYLFPRDQRVLYHEASGAWIDPNTKLEVMLSDVRKLGPIFRLVSEQ